MDTIQQKELRNNIGAVLRRAEAGEEFTITVSGRPVARLGPVQPAEWVGAVAMSKVWDTPGPESLADDLEGFSVELSDPFAD